MSMTRKAVAAAAGLVVGVVLSGCGKEPAPQPPKESNPFAGVPFVLAPDETGKLVLRNANGKPLQAAAISLPVESKSVQAVSQVTVLKIEGSCYYLVCHNGSCYQVPC